VSELAITGCKFGWWCDEYRIHDKSIVVPPKSRVYVEPLPTTPVKPRTTKQPNMLTPWQGEGPVLEPTPLPPAEALKPVQPNTPSSVKEREIKRATYKDEVVA
jgi:hypothetical protein